MARMLPLTELQAVLRAQGAPESHLARLGDLVALAQREPRLQAMFLVGSYAKGSGDRVSDLDLVVIAAPGQADAVLQAAHDLLDGKDVLDRFCGSHPGGGSFWKLVYLDFSSVELHVFEPPTTFGLRRPYLPLWDPHDVVGSYVVEGDPVRHQDFSAYEYGDRGLIWELLDCIKWLSRGHTELAKNHLRKVVARMDRRGD